MTWSAERDARIAFGAFVLDCADERLWGPSGPVRLGRKAYLVLLSMLRTPGRLVTKEDLFSSVWDGTIVSESVLTTVVKELRRALGDDRADARLIETVYGRGYRFVGHVRAEAPPRVVAQPSFKPAPKSAPHPTIVLVSAFDDTAVRDRQPWLGTVLREEILLALARFREIRLIADHAGETMRRWGEGERGYRLIAALLPDGDSVKVISRVKRLPDGEIVWAESISLSGGGLAEGVETIVRRIVGAALPAVDQDVFLGLPEGGDDFYGRYLRARIRSFEARGFDEVRATGEALRALIEERPDFGLAYPPLVRLLNTDFAYTGLGTTGPAERDEALALAKAGLAADPRHAHAHLVLGFCHLWHEQWDLARECLEQSLALNPYNPKRLREVASGLMWLGNLDRAAALFEQSLALQPLVDDAYHEDRAELALLRGDIAEARGHLRRVQGGRLWSALYEGMTDSDPEKLTAWCGRIAQDWHGEDALDRKRLEQWIGFHRAFAPALKAPFMALVGERLDSIEAQPISRASVEMKQVIGGGA